VEVEIIGGGAMTTFAGGARNLKYATVMPICSAAVMLTRTAHKDKDKE